MRTLTAEQAQVAQAASPIVRVNAYAGTGKTASLVAWTQAHPRHRILYLAFNKSVQLQAVQRFPRSVTTKTGHALAFPVTGKAYTAKLVDSLTPWMVLQAHPLSPSPPGAETLWADVIVRTLARYVASPDPVVGISHIPLGAADWQGPFAWADPVHAVRDAQRLWERMCDPQDLAVGMTHDGYLKRYALTQPKLPYDAILFDEAQDANPVILQLVTTQRQAQQIYVGDPYQAIYHWRGAVDAMQQIPATETYRLTASFRFGPVLAAAATRLLRWFDPQLPALRGLAPDPGEISVGGVRQGPVTVLARSNARLFAEAVRWLDRDPAVRLHWVGGIEGYHLEWLIETFRLWRGEPVRSPFLQLFPDFATLQAYAETVEDVEWQGRCRMVERWGARLPPLVRRVHAASTPQAREATLQLATIHKAKGLEWPSVVILDDLAPLDDRLTPEDHHLWYVAMTRATRGLIIPDAAWQALQLSTGNP
ncbi:UvrD-helicase domain-containing protein [Sulfobacillus thermosulfidooxidans]|uniref:UvrD-helicase domain-containing protein n=1 Tax=Sulfobacillus thermosulfidooxidans TaxID=28034 RepID=UPI0002DB3B77|nr:UvrD-helicase domain-containing protein [Sulfobacillus thermosulfidooxidans]